MRIIRTWLELLEMKSQTTVHLYSRLNSQIYSNVLYDCAGAVACKRQPGDMVPPLCPRLCDIGSTCVSLHSSSPVSKEKRGDRIMVYCKD